MKVLLTFLFSIHLHYSNAHQLQVDIVDGGQLQWTTFLKDYIKHDKPVILQKAFRSSPAYRKWYRDYVYYHSVSALTFYLAAGHNTTLRKVLQHRQNYIAIHTQMPWHLAADITVPPFFDCDLIAQYLKTPSLIWYFHTASDEVAIQAEPAVICVARNRLSIYMIRDWAISMDGQDGEDVLDSDVAYYQLDLREGDCAYLPPDYLRFIKYKRDSIAVKFVLSQNAIHDKHYDNCQSLGGLAYDAITLMDNEYVPYIANSESLRLFIILLGPDDEKCFSEETLVAAFIEDGDSASKKEEIGDLIGEVFDLLDVNNDGLFCWNDIDILTYEQAKKLANELQSIGATILETYLHKNETIANSESKIKTAQVPNLKMKTKTEL